MDKKISVALRIGSLLLLASVLWISAIAIHNTASKGNTPIAYAALAGSGDACTQAGNPGGTPYSMGATQSGTQVQDLCCNTNYPSPTPPNPQTLYPSTPVPWLTCSVGSNVNSSGGCQACCDSNATGYMREIFIPGGILTNARTYNVPMCCSGAAGSSPQYVIVGSGDNQVCCSKGQVNVPDSYGIAQCGTPPNKSVICTAPTATPISPGGTATFTLNIAPNPPQDFTGYTCTYSISATQNGPAIAGGTGSVPCVNGSTFSITAPSSTTGSTLYATIQVMYGPTPTGYSSCSPVPVSPVPPTSYHCVAGSGSGTGSCVKGSGDAGSPACTATNNTTPCCVSPLSPYPATSPLVCCNNSTQTYYQPSSGTGACCTSPKKAAGTAPAQACCMPPSTTSPGGEDYYKTSAGTGACCAELKPANKPTGNYENRTCTNPTTKVTICCTDPKTECNSTTGQCVLPPNVTCVASLTNPPVSTDTSSLKVAVGTSFTITATTTTTPLPTFNWTYTPPPPAAPSNSHPTSQSFTLKATANGASAALGVNTYTVTATNSIGSATSGCSVTIVPLDFKVKCTVTTPTPKGLKAGQAYIGSTVGFQVSPIPPSIGVPPYTYVWTGTPTGSTKDQYKPCTGSACSVVESIKSPATVKPCDPNFTAAASATGTVTDSAGNTAYDTCNVTLVYPTDPLTVKCTASATQTGKIPKYGPPAKKGSKPKIIGYQYVYTYTVTPTITGSVTDAGYSWYASAGANPVPTENPSCVVSGQMKTPVTYTTPLMSTTAKPPKTVPAVTFHVLGISGYQKGTGNCTSSTTVVTVAPSSSWFASLLNIFGIK